MLILLYRLPEPYLGPLLLFLQKGTSKVIWLRSFSDHTTLISLLCNSMSCQIQNVFPAHQSFLYMNSFSWKEFYHVGLAAFVNNYNCLKLCVIPCMKKALLKNIRAFIFFSKPIRRICLDCEIINAKDYSWTDAVPYELWVNTTFPFLILKCKTHKNKTKMRLKYPNSLFH